MPTPNPPLELFASPVIINEPPVDASSWPVNEYCQIAARGAGHPDFVAEVTGVSGRINGGAEQSGSVYGCTWWFDALGLAGTGCTNVLEVKIRFVPTTGSGETWSEWEPREFTGAGGEGCYGYCPSLMLAAAAPASETIQRALPRYLRLTLAAQGGAAGLDLAAQSGGLLQPASVYLAYDHLTSTHQEAVWRALNLPERMGHWTLRARAERGGMTAELSHHRLSEREVAAPVVYRVSPWDPRSPSLLTAADCGCGASAALAQHVLTIEPA